MTKKQMLYIASERLYHHFIKLYFPEELDTPNPRNPTADQQRIAHFEMCNYMRGRGAAGFRLFSFLRACDRRETEILCLGRPRPEKLTDEIQLLLRDAEDYLHPHKGV